MQHPTIGPRGILILTPPFHIVYMNAAARAIVAQINKRQPAYERNVTLPTDIMHFCHSVMAFLQDSVDRPSPRSFAFHREIEGAGDRLLLRGVVFSKPEGFLQSYACILMDWLHSETDHSGNHPTRSACHV